MDGGADGANHFSRQAAHLVLGWGRGLIRCICLGRDGDFFEENRDPLDGFVTHGSLGCGQLERVRYFVREGGWGKGLALGLGVEVRFVNLP